MKSGYLVSKENKILTNKNPQASKYPFSSVAVLGMGYVGLPLLLENAFNGLEAVGLEVCQEKIKDLNNGISYIESINNDLLLRAKEEFSVIFTSDTSYIRRQDVVVICVPTPLDKNNTPDLSFIKNACFTISQNLKKGHLVSLESTTYPGTIDEVVRPILESTGLRCGKDFFLAYSPERIDPGNRFFSTQNTTKIVAADDKESLARAVSFYKLFIKEVVSVLSTRAAEMAKVFENSFRSVNLALVNEMSQLCHRMGIDVNEMLRLSFTKPFGIMPFFPGPGVGGHCVPVDPHYLQWKAKEYNFNTSLLAVSDQINRSMPSFVAQRIVEILNKQGKALSQSKILLVGMSYKENISDTRESPGLMLWSNLQKLCNKLQYHDPHVSHLEIKGNHIESVDLESSTISEMDLVVLLVKHDLVDFNLVKKHSKLIFDTRNIYSKDIYPNIIPL